MTDRIFRVSDEDKLHSDLTAEVFSQLVAASDKSPDDWRNTDIVDWAATIADNLLTILDTAK